MLHSSSYVITYVRQFWILPDAMKAKTSDFQGQLFKRGLT